MAVLLVLVMFLGTISSIASLGLSTFESRAMESSSITMDESTLSGNRDLIVGGTVANPRDFPFFALTAPDSYAITANFVCGASLIHSDIIVSAAHCQGYFNYGVLMFNNKTNAFDRRTRIVEQMRHPNYNLNNSVMNWDILVMRLDEPVYDITPVPLNRDPHVPIQNEILTAAGFGATAYGRIPSSILLEGTFKYMTPNECANKIQQFHVTGAVDGPELLCVGPSSAGNSICSGDSGGPLLTQNDVLVGTTSWTVECQIDQVPNGFTRVSTLYNWIQEKICEMSVDKPSNCPTAQTQTKPPNTMVKMKLLFHYDFQPEQTTYAVRNRQTKAIEHVGPTYVVSQRVSSTIWTSYFYLAEGKYDFEVYDKGGNGMGDTQMNATPGFWKLYALHQQGANNYTLVASGGSVFYQQSTTNFEVYSPTTASPQRTPEPTPLTTALDTNLTTVIPEPTNTTAEESSAYPTPAPTIPAFPIPEKQRRMDAYEYATALIVAIVLLQCVVFVRARSGLGIPRWFPAIARALSRTSGPFTGSMATFAGQLGGFASWRQSFRARASTTGKSDPADRFQHHTEQGTAASGRDSDTSSPIGGRLAGSSLNSRDQSTASNDEHPLAAARTYLYSWYRNVFAHSIDTEESVSSEEVVQA